jgi:2-polyprenyl-3-methyl-5-hydroxy-6-metoxy-1,4-benzoquinol methylase
MASGTGHLAQRLADSGANVVAVDFAPEMIRVARERFSRSRFR